MKLNENGRPITCSESQKDLFEYSKANNICTNCGICAAECPVKAIPKDNPRTVDKTKCIACMHCISVCPNHSRVNNKILTFVSAQALKKSCGSRKQNQLFLGK